MLRFYTCLSYQNKVVSTQMLVAAHEDVELQQTLIKHLGRDKPLAIRNLAAKWCVSISVRTQHSLPGKYRALRTVASKFYDITSYG